MTTRVALTVSSLVVLVASCHLVTGVGDATFEPEGAGGASTSSGMAGSSSSMGGASTSTGGTSSSSGGGGGTGGTMACGHATHPPNGTCPAVCDSCEGSLCNIECQGSGSAYDCGARFGNTIICPAGWDCSVACQGSDACHWISQGISIACPAGHRCDVGCAGSSACRNLDVACAPDGPCGLDCVVADAGCRDAELLCGSNDCTLTCDEVASMNQRPEPLDCTGSDCVCVDTTCFP